MEKQTAIEWLIEQCPRIETIVAYNILEQAKQMEKDQLQEMYLNGIQNYDPTFKRKSQWTEVDNMTKRLK
jgi:hypothetical protein